MLRQERASTDWGSAELPLDDLPGLVDHERGVLAPVGDRLFVYGGINAGADPSVDIPFSNEAVLINPGEGRGRAIATPPVEGAIDPSRAGAFAHGGRVDLVGGVCNDFYPYGGDPEVEECPLDEAVALQFDLGTGRWSTGSLPPPLVDRPDASFKLADVADSGTFVAAITTSDSIDAQPSFWRRAPSGPEWLAIPAPDRRPLGYCLTGDSIAVLQAGFRLGDEILADDPTLSEDGRGTPLTAGVTQGDGWVDAYVSTYSLGDPERGWVDTGPIDGWYESPLGFGRTLVCAGTSLVVGDGRGAFHQNDVLGSGEDSWESLPVAPADVSAHRPVAVGGTVAFLPLSSLIGDGGRAFAYDTTRRQWRREPDLDRAGQVVAQGDRLVGWATGTAGSTSGDKLIIDVVVDQG